MRMDLNEIERLLNECGARQYGGEAVSQLEHALQCALLAEKAGETEATIAAALLHDLGHMIVADSQVIKPPSNGHDDMHELIAMTFLRDLFPQSVLKPIELHVKAKRYLCEREPEYWAKLSEASRLSLHAQGGVFTAEQAQFFMSQPFAEQAVRLRRYDDLAKRPGEVTPGLDHYLPLLRRVQTRPRKASDARLEQA